MSAEMLLSWLIVPGILHSPSDSTEELPMEGEAPSSDSDPQPQSSSAEGEALPSDSDPQPQSLSALGETTMVGGSSGNPQVLADTSRPQSPISSPPSEDADELGPNQALQNGEGNNPQPLYIPGMIFLTSEEGSDSGAENRSNSSATSSSSTIDPRIYWNNDWEVVEQGSLVNRTKAKLQKSRKNTGRTSWSSPGSYRSLRLKEHDQDTLSPDELSSESVKGRGSKSKANRHTCEACKKTFARRADVPRHKKSACPVIGKKHLLCEGCGREYSRPDAIQRHRRNGDCSESMYALRQDRKG